MSRSYKKTPSFGWNSPGAKRLANKRVRKAKNISLSRKGSGYKHLSSSYDICDYYKPVWSHPQYWWSVLNGYSDEAEMKRRCRMK